MTSEICTYHEALKEYEGDGPSLFLAGGITGCPDWQQEMRRMLSGTELALLNPRRANFPIHDPNAAKKQIAWEWRHLQKADAVSFWFAKETIQPIVLFELGRWSSHYEKLIFVGVHPEYSRKQDVQIQLDLERLEVCIVSTLELLVDQVKGWAADV